MYRPYIRYVQRSWCFKHVFQIVHCNINNTFILFLKLFYSNIALSNDTKFSISLKKSAGPKMSESDTYIYKRVLFTKTFYYCRVNQKYLFSH